MSARLAADRHLLGPAGVFGARDGSPGGALGADSGPGALIGVEAGRATATAGAVRDAAAVRRRRAAGLQAASAGGAPALQHPGRVVRFAGRRPGAAGAAGAGPGRVRLGRVRGGAALRVGGGDPAVLLASGALLALLHALDGTDLHHENLIACGPHPVLVDVETLFHPPLGPARSSDPAARALHDSVHRVGLLPQLLVGDTTALDMSAIGGGREASSPVATADWADAGTDRMRLVRRAGRFTESANRPRLGGVAADPSAYTDALCGGFSAGYTAIGEHRDELLGERGLLNLFARDEVRVVPRPTWTYTTLLDESTHPDLMRDAAERHRVLSLLRTPLLGAPGRPGVEDEEIAELWCGDVPVFATLPGGTELWSGTGRTVPPPADARADDPTGLDRVEAKVRAMDTVDRQDQERIIRAAMVSTSPEPAHRAAAGGRPRGAARAPEPSNCCPPRGRWATSSSPSPTGATAAPTGSGSNCSASATGGSRRWRRISRPVTPVRALPRPTGRAHRRVPVRGGRPGGARPGPGAAGRAARAGRRARPPGLRRLRGPRRYRVRADRGGRAARRPGRAGPGRPRRTALLCGGRGGDRVRGARRCGGRAGLDAGRAPRDRAPGGVAGSGPVRRADHRGPAARLRGLRGRRGGVGWALLRFAGAGGDARFRDAGLHALRRATAPTAAAGPLHGPAAIGSGALATGIPTNGSGSGVNGRPVGTAGAVAPTAAEAVHGPAWCEGRPGSRWPSRTARTR